MPELPEVQTTLTGIQPHILGRKIQAVVIREHRLRWPINPELPEILAGQTLDSLTRRGKYLLLGTKRGTLILHLGMSGSLRIFTKATPPGKHDHIDLIFAPNICLRLRDPRRFGACVWTDADPLQHALLKHLGPEPFNEDFSGDYLWELSRKRKVPIKSFIMDSKTVVGVGNIYAAEALFASGIKPTKPAGKVSLASYNTLAKAIREILQAAIQQGGTTLKDFVNSDGAEGYFSLKLNVYGRGGLLCRHCKTILKEMRLGQRSTVYCGHCQS